MKVKRNREWALEFTALPINLALDANGFGRGQSQQLIIADPETAFGLSPFWVNRFLGNYSIVADLREEPPAFGFWGLMAFGLLRSNNTGSESFNLTDIDIMADEDSDNPWLYRQFRTMFVRDTRVGTVDPALGFAPVAEAHLLAVNMDQWRLGTAGGAITELTQLVHSPTDTGIDWAIRGGRGTRLEHDAGVSLHVSFLSFLPTAANIHYTGDGWTFTLGVAGTFLFTTQ